MGLLQQASINGILAMGMMFVVISGGIDLSVGAIVACTGVIAASLAHPGQHALIVAILAPVLNLSQGFRAVSGGVLGPGVPCLVLYFAAVTAISAVLLRLTVFGRRVYATGGNAVAAAVSGIGVPGIRIAVYTLSGLLAGFAGVLLASRTLAGSPSAGEGYELNAIAAVLLSGVSLHGGVGTWYGTLLAALLIAVLDQGLDHLNVPPSCHLVVLGLIIYLAVHIDGKGKGPGR
jgi:ribose/xylose/arabinose/galactoside ABC-type transport system permease subunit